MQLNILQHTPQTPILIFICNSISEISILLYSSLKGGVYVLVTHHSFILFLISFTQCFSLLTSTSFSVFFSLRVHRRHISLTIDFKNFRDSSDIRILQLWGLITNSLCLFNSLCPLLCVSLYLYEYVRKVFGLS